MTRLPEPILPIPDSDIKGIDFSGMKDVIIKTANMMGTARRCNLARLLFTLQHRQYNFSWMVKSRPEGVQILIRVSDSVLFYEYSPHPPKFSH